MRCSGVPPETSLQSLDRSVIPLAKARFPCRAMPKLKSSPERREERYSLQSLCMAREVVFFRTKTLAFTPLTITSTPLLSIIRHHTSILSVPLKRPPPRCCNTPLPPASPKVC